MKTESEIFAEFMGIRKIKSRSDKPLYFVKSDGTKSINSTRHRVNFKYASDWRWIMPVVEKFNMLDPSIFNYDAVSMTELRRQQEIIQALSIVTPIHIVYRYLVSAIKWYNEKAKDQPS